MIKRERLKRNLTQGDLGRLIDRSQSNISAIERHEMPKFDIACLICEVFNLDPTYVWQQIKDDPVYARQYNAPGRGDAEQQAES